MSWYFNPFTAKFDYYMSGGESGANTALSNLSSVAINTSLISDTDSTDDLGSSTKYWKNLYVDKALFHSTNTATFTTSGGGGYLTFLGSHSSAPFIFRNDTNDRVFECVSNASLGATFGVKATGTGGHEWRFQSYTNASSQGGGVFGFYNGTKNTTQFALNGNTKQCYITYGDNEFGFQEADNLTQAQLHLWGDSSDKAIFEFGNAYRDAEGDRKTQIVFCGYDDGAYGGENREIKWSITANDNSTTGQTFSIVNEKGSQAFLEFSNIGDAPTTKIWIPKSGADQSSAGAGAGELWTTSGHESLPDGVVMYGL